MAGTAKVSKNSRTTTSAGSAAVTAGAARLIIPCNSGKNAYVHNLTTGLNKNLATNSDAFIEEIRAAAGTVSGDRIRSEFEALAEAHPADGWDATLARLVDAGALV